MAELLTWFTTRLAVLKMLQILSSVITILFLIEGRTQWGAYTLIFVSAIVLAVVTFITLIAYFMEMHKRSKLPWELIEIGFNLVATILSLVYTGVLAYDASKMFGGEFNHHRYHPPKNIGYDGWRNRILIVTVAQALNAIFYLVSLYRTKTKGIR
ncbi:membrane-associating domain-containing protein [Ditylenchus destructor]|nr:membrane-associating domain-containing protein [Ditylenchus destructor]